MGTQSVNTVLLAAIGAAIGILSAAIWIVHERCIRRISHMEIRLASLAREVHASMEATDSAHRQLSTLRLDVKRLAEHQKEEVTHIKIGDAHARSEAPEIFRAVAPPVVSEFAHKLGTISTEPEPAEPEYSVSLVHELFAHWSRNGRAPRLPSTIEVARLEYSKREASGEIGAPPRHVLLETTGVGQFIRFSRREATDGFLFPNPDAHYASVMRDIFPTIGREEHGDPGTLGAVQPVRVRRRVDLEWEVV